MKKLFFTLLVVSLTIPFCGKKSTTPTVEDKVTLEVTVTENGSPKSGVYVRVFALVKKYTLSRVDGSSTRGDYYTETQEEEVLSNVYGKSIFTWNDQSVPDRDGIVIEKIVLSVFNDVVLEDTEEKLIKKNGSLALTYDIGG
ncbi:hypothetical protein ACFL4T_01830 [candidate division KSB1 bacterium]